MGGVRDGGRVAGRDETVYGGSQARCAGAVQVRVVVILQARTGSSRLPGKMLLPLAGRPLLGYLLERLRAGATIWPVIVATGDGPGDDRLSTIAEAYGAAVFRGSEVDVLDRVYRAAVANAADLVVRLCGDNPLVDPAAVDRAVALFTGLRSDRIDYVSNDLTYPDGPSVEVVPLAVLERAWREATSPADREHVTRYIWRNSSDLTFHARWRVPLLEPAFPLFRLATFGFTRDLSALSLNVNTRADYERVARLVDALGPGSRFLPLEEIAAFAASAYAI